MVNIYMAIIMPMSKKIYLALMAAILLKSSFVYSQSITELTITGKITDSTCGDVVVNGGQPVNFGNLEVAQLQGDQFSIPVNFMISFINCHTELRNRATISFGADTVPGSNDKYIQLEQITNSASGLAIALRDPENREVVFNAGATEAQSYNLNEGDLNLDFQAFLVPITGGSGVQAGSIQAKATFIVEYN